MLFRSDSTEVSDWLIDNDPVTLCKALGLYKAAPKVKKGQPPDYIIEVDQLIASNQYVQAIKFVRERFGWGLKEAKFVLDVYTERVDVLGLSDHEYDLYIEYFKDYRKN